jgi:hypothetical protein
MPIWGFKKPQRKKVRAREPIAEFSLGFSDAQIIFTSFVEEI